ncbi:hypothetical protein ES288_A08G106600v1 [Gossypium darwinii]|uniref:Uncharacterized protein n=1 Tax=Gossypium darwinii TaxID=34276 RepID=A0A5D2FII7_GOSDA|nr:hypothetical protein ES288_A08G106600v1 [Gossypium darwinii]
MLNLHSMPPPARVAPAPPASAALATLAPFDPAPPTPQTVASEAPTLSAQPTPPTMPTSSTQQILTRLRSRENKLTVIQILNPGMREETMVTAPTKCTNKRKGSNNKETIGGTQESRNTKKAKFRDLSKQNRKP